MQTIGQYQIDIYRDEAFVKGPIDILHTYDIEHFNESNYVFSTMLGIKVFKDNSLLKSAIIGSGGGGTGIHKNSVIYEKARLLICCADTIFCLSIPDLALLWKTQADQSTCFGIYTYQDSFIVHGELEITRIGKDGKILWQQSGVDIFTTKDGKQDFELTDKFIIARDFENRDYKFDYEGKDFTDKTQFS